MFGLGQIGKDVKSFVSGKDLVVMSIALALSTQFQATVKSVVDNLFMPFVSKITGATNLNSRSFELVAPSGKELGIKVTWGAALQSVIVFLITLVIMVQIAKYLTLHYVKSSSVSFT